MIFLSFVDNAIAADYLNYKNGLGPTKIYCMLADKREWRFFEIDFEQNPYKVWKSKDTCFITATEGTIDFLIQVKQGKFYRFSKYLILSMWCSAFFPHCCVCRWYSILFEKVCNPNSVWGKSFPLCEVNGPEMLADPCLVFCHQQSTICV